MNVGIGFAVVVCDGFYDDFRFLGSGRIVQVGERLSTKGFSEDGEVCPNGFGVKGGAHEIPALKDDLGIGEGASELLHAAQRDARLPKIDFLEVLHFSEGGETAIGHLGVEQVKIPKVFQIAQAC